MKECQRVISRRDVGSIERGDIGYIDTIDRKNQKAICYFYSSNKKVMMELVDLDSLFNKEG